MKTTLADITGQRFGKLTAQWPAGVGPRNKIFWLFLCDCGTVKVIRADSVKRRKRPTRGCGCALTEFNKRPGKGKHFHNRIGQQTREYRTWSTMIQRCTNPKNTSWRWYGGRGICVCERWRKFENFLADVGSRPLGKTLDRFPNKDGNYEPGNYRWATPKEQVANSHKPHLKRKV